MEFRYPDIEAALAAMHSIADERRSAFSNRLRHLQKNGFPPGTNPGRGKAVVYNVRHAVQMAVILEMNQVGLNPERAMNLAKENMSRIQAATYLAATEMRSGDEEAILLVFDPVTLADLRDKNDWDETSASFDVKSLSEFRASLEDGTNLRSRRYALINVTEVVSALSHQLSLMSKYNEFAIMEEIQASANEAGAWSYGNP